MKLIVGLGNPGEKYKNTRHNLGYIVLETFAKNHGLSWRYSPEWIGYFIKTADFILLKPGTFMNKSGESTAPPARFFRIENKDILVVHDDLDLEFGKIKLSFDSSSGGHKGVESVIGSLGSMDFVRLRVGIDHPPHKVTDASKLWRRSVSDGEGDEEEYVLKKFTKEELAKLPQIIERCIEAINTYVTGGIEATMNQFN